MKINERLSVFLSEWNFVHTQINHKHSVHTHTRCAGVCVCFQFRFSLQSVRVCFFYSFVSVHRKTTTAATHSSSKKIIKLSFDMDPILKLRPHFTLLYIFRLRFFSTVSSSHRKHRAYWHHEHTHATRPHTRAHKIANTRNSWGERKKMTFESILREWSRRTASEVQINKANKITQENWDFRSNALANFRSQPMCASVV